MDINFTDYERNVALRNAHHIHDSDAYFEARPQIDSNDRRKVFEAGYERAWESLRQQLTKPADAELIEAAKAVVERWETPLWKDAPATAGYIYRLRDAINAYKPTEG
jgi:hypothetical protein